MAYFPLAYCAPAQRLWSNRVTITATTCEMNPLLTAAQEPARVPIGRPLANRRAFILDHARNPVPIGILGELYLGGEGLARGYLNRPELTSERFIEHAFAGEPPQRLYRTGDVARYRADGTIEVLGRTDQQVKLRGYRIEPGEIETVLRREAQVKDAVVVVQGEGEHRRLVAYVVPHQVSTPTTQKLFGFLKANLPSYMIPSTFVA